MRPAGRSATPPAAPCAGLPEPAAVREIVALMLGEIGDIIVTTPTLACLRRVYPAARLRVVLRRAMAPLLAHHPDVDGLLLYDPSTRWTKAAFLARLALQRTDLWVDLHTPTFNTWNSNDQVFRRNRLFMRAAHPRFQRAFEVPALRRRLTHPVPVPDDETLRRENIVDTTLRLVGAAREAAPRAKRVEPGADATAWARAQWAERGLDGVPCIGLFFGAKQSAKVWPADQVLALCRTLPARHPGAAFGLLGGPHERASVAALRRALPAELGAEGAARFHDFTDAGGLDRSAAVIGRCQAVVATDSGPMHLADAMGVPLVALMSAHNHPGLWNPLNAVAVLREAVPCSPCLSAECSQGQACMKAIQPPQVLQALGRALALDTRGPA